MLGPWKSAKSLRELAMKTGWGKGKPRLAEVEVDLANLYCVLTGEPASEAIAALDLDVEPETLERRMKKRRESQSNRSKVKNLAGR